MAMLSWQIGKVELRELTNLCEHLTVWSWASWKRGIGNLAEHWYYSIEELARTTLFYSIGFNEPLCSGQGLKISHHFWEMHFEKVFEKCCNVSPTLLTEGKGAENTKEKSRQCLMAIMSFCRLKELGKISIGNITNVATSPN